MLEGENISNIGNSCVCFLFQEAYMVVFATFLFLTYWPAPKSSRLLNYLRVRVATVAPLMRSGTNVLFSAFCIYSYRASTVGIRHTQQE